MLLCIDRKASSPRQVVSRGPGAFLKTLDPRLLHAGMTVLGILFFSSCVFAFGNDNAGTSGAAFLKIAPGARPVGMGEAFTGVADDIHSVYFNPAGLAMIHKPE